MSVIIKGMKMPESCQTCPLNEWSEAVNDCICPFDFTICNKDGRKVDCPIIEIPEKHGGLIDTSSMVDMPFYNDEYEEIKIMRVPVDNILDLAENVVQTILEAED